MSTEETISTQAAVASIREELLDSFDEEFEMEMDEARLERSMRNTSEDPFAHDRVDRRVYFK